MSVASRSPVDDLRERFSDIIDGFDQVADDFEEFEDAPEDFKQKGNLFARLDILKRSTDELLGLVKAKKALIEEQLLEEMGVLGISSFKSEGLTVSPRESLHVNKAKGVEASEIYKALLKANWGDVAQCGYMPGALKARVKEMIDEGSKLPADLKDLVSVYKKVVLSTTKSSRSK